MEVAALTHLPGASVPHFVPLLFTVHDRITQLIDSYINLVNRAARLSWRCLRLLVRRSQIVGHAILGFIPVK